MTRPGAMKLVEGVVAVMAFWQMGFRAVYRGPMEAVIERFDDWEEQDVKEGANAAVAVAAVGEEEEEAKEKDVDGREALLALAAGVSEAVVDMAKLQLEGIADFANDWTAGEYESGLQNDRVSGSE